MNVNATQAVTAIATAFILVPVTYAAQPEPDLLDTGFADQICKGWNQTSLPSLVGRSGSGWIDSAGSKGRQVIVVNRRDCTGWQPIQLTIESDAKGNAQCVASGDYNGGEMQWKFEPKTSQWADFSDGFGVTKMPGIMPGFVGPYTTAMNNISNFEVFFAMVGHIAHRQNVSWECTGAVMKDVREEVADIDTGDTREILAGMAILKTL